jgi:hypothetical protein
VVPVLYAASRRSRAAGAEVVDAPG